MTGKETHTRLVALSAVSVAVSVAAFLCLSGPDQAAAADVNPAQQVLGDNGKPLGITAGGNGSTVFMHLVASAKCIAVGSTKHAVRWDCDGGRAEQFKQIDNGDRTWSFWWAPSTGERYCLDSLSGQRPNGTQLELVGCNAGASQRWKIGAHGELLSMASAGKCLQDPTPGSVNGIRLQLWDCTAYPPAPQPPAAAAAPAPAAGAVQAPASSQAAAPDPAPKQAPAPNQAPDPAPKQAPAAQQAPAPKQAPAPAAQQAPAPNEAQAPDPAAAPVLPSVPVPSEQPSTPPSPSAQDSAQALFVPAPGAPPSDDPGLATTASGARTRWSRPLVSLGLILVVAALVMALLLVRAMPRYLPAVRRMRAGLATGLPGRWRALRSGSTQTVSRLWAASAGRLRPAGRAPGLGAGVGLPLTAEPDASVAEEVAPGSPAAGSPPVPAAEPEPVPAPVAEPVLAPVAEPEPVAAPAAAPEPEPAPLASSPLTVAVSAGADKGEPLKPGPQTSAAAPVPALVQLMGIATKVGSEIPGGALPGTPGPAAPESGPTRALPQSEAAPAGTSAGAVEIQPQRALAAPTTVLPGHRSTAENRANFRELMQRRYDVHARAVLQTLATNPGLRSAAVGASAASEDSDVCDLAAVRAFVCDDWPEQPQAAQIDAWTACVVSGLRMLPTFRGVTYAWYGRDEAGLSSLSVGQLFTPEHVLRTRVRSGTVPEGSEVEVIVWSESGRRTGVLLAEETGEEILFPAWTSFRVLSCRVGRGSAPARVLLRQLTAAEAKGLSRASGEADAEVLKERDARARSGLLTAIGEPAVEIPAGVSGAVR